MIKFVIALSLTLFSFSCFAQTAQQDPKKRITVTMTLQSWSDLVNSLNTSAQIAGNNDNTTQGQIRVISKGYKIMNDSLLAKINVALGVKAPKVPGTKPPVPEPVDTTEKQ